MSLEGKVILVTGAARGMGREYVRGFLGAGARVIAADISWAPTGVSNDDLDFQAELAANSNALTELMDITMDGHVKRVFEAAMERFGTVDVIINNAGLRQRDLYPPEGSRTVLETEVSDWQRMFDTHVFGSLRVIKAFSKPMLENRRGSIINIGSSAWGGQNPSTREMPYKSAKAGLVSMSMYLAHELRLHNVAVNVLIPGHTRSTGSDEQQAGRIAINARENPTAMSRPTIRVRPDHVVPLAMYLAEQDAGALTGQEISAMRWNQDNGLGGIDTWAYASDLEAARAAGHPIG
jgi:NAD(P)-dependent dehydrogenase (short-subunit alcohol dehydrogenase family)